MGSERKKYYAEVAGNYYEFQGVAYIYDKIKDKIGIKLVSERTAGAAGATNRKVVRAPEEVKRTLPRITIVLELDNAVTGGNAAQQDQSGTTRRMKVYCDPDKMEDGLKKLTDTVIDGVGVTGNQRRRKITNAYIALKRCYV